MDYLGPLCSSHKPPRLLGILISVQCCDHLLNTSLYYQNESFMGLGMASVFVLFSPWSKGNSVADDRCKTGVKQVQMEMKNGEDQRA